MRLDNKELNALEKAIENIDGEVYIFGSRVDDTRKGGDIDILILSREQPFSLSRRVAVNFFMECEEKIDVIVMDPDNLSMIQNAFLNTLKIERFR